MANGSRGDRIGRLRGREQFDAVFTHGALRRRGWIIVRSRPNGLGYPRLGIVAGRKALPRAVDRNRCKRVLREAFRAVETMLPGIDIVVQFRDPDRRRPRLTLAEATNLFTALT